MGGHGALTIAFKNPGLFKSVSAFSPICNPINCPWYAMSSFSIIIFQYMIYRGQKAFTNYLGTDTSAWKEYDATEILKSQVY
jgi:S-formylglutathione hydrolase